MCCSVNSEAEIIMKRKKKKERTAAQRLLSLRKASHYVTRTSRALLDDQPFMVHMDSQYQLACCVSEPYATSEPMPGQMSFLRQCA